jgi:hypothetical protein
MASDTKTANKWTKTELKALSNAVKTSKTEGKPIKTAFEEIAKLRGSSAASVQAKWYTLNPGARARKSTAQTTNTTSPSKVVNKRVGKKTNRRVSKPQAAPSPTLKSAVMDTLASLAAKREFCGRCETPFTGEHTADACANNLRERLTVVQSSIVAAMPTNGKVPEFV